MRLIPLLTRPEETELRLTPVARFSMEVMVDNVDTFEPIEVETVLRFWVVKLERTEMEVETLETTKVDRELRPVRVVFDRSPIEVDRLDTVDARPLVLTYVCPRPVTVDTKLRELT